MKASSTQANQAQSALWNTRAGAAWVAQQALLDRLFLPFEHMLTQIAQDSGASQILDIGCGAGATTLAVAQSLAASGHCTGVDISLPLIEAARRRAQARHIAAAFLADDAQTHPFQPQGFDGVISRFGVMFFDDPEAAFANLRRAVCPGASLTFIAWRGRDENPFMTAAERAADRWLPQLDVMDATAPGQFAFADAARVRGILSGAWLDIDIQPLDVPCALSEADLHTYALGMGRVGVRLPDLADPLRATVSDAILQAYARYMSAGMAHFTAACWLVRARAG
ncbi:class I SAM-dependent methyltransferase [Sphingobium boeckii]|uniref:SAM-dependent methyltransferase n=1 Tax=Sphingobium boeckii TaxID=1082345 RepID=A0A7W9AH10_9SPHN|nr:class I SAM-dependent methyltransferase [Sphingobium boeckii]MBB5685540.1 SAM-dependent methyltransferase [Sphingobium boeckii]